MLRLLRGQVAVPTPRITLKGSVPLSEHIALKHEFARANRAYAEERVTSAKLDQVRFTHHNATLCICTFVVCLRAWLSMLTATVFFYTFCRSCGRSWSTRLMSPQSCPHSLTPCLSCDPYHLHEYTLDASYRLIYTEATLRVFKLKEFYYGCDTSFLLELDGPGDSVVESAPRRTGRLNRCYCVQSEDSNWHLNCEV